MRSTPSTSQKRNDEFSWSLIRVVRPTGTTKNRPTASASAKRTVPAHVPLPISSSSSAQLGVGGDAERLEADRQRLAERDDAADDRQAQDAVLLEHRHERDDWTAISPSVPSGRPSVRGRGTATAHVRDAAHHHALEDGLAADGRVALRRIRRAAGRRARRSRRPRRALGGDAPRSVGARPLGGAALEALDAATGVDQLLLARVERVAVGADLDVDLGLVERVVNSLPQVQRT